MFGLFNFSLIVFSHIVYTVPECTQYVTRAHLPLQLVNVSLCCFAHHWWIKGLLFDGQKIVDSKHMRYLCPLRRGARACGLTARSDSKLIANHSCAYLRIAPILNTETVTFIPRPLQNDTFTRLAHALSGNKILTEEITEETTSFISSLFWMLAKCNISFSAATSHPFKEFLRHLISLSNPEATPTANILLSKLHLKTLARLVVFINRERKKKLLTAIRNKSVSLMMDAADVSGKSVMAITILPHVISSKPEFWKLVVGCSGAESYAKLSEHLINELSSNETRVLFFCTDGLASQRSGIEKCTPKRIGDLIFYPYHIWCCSHLTNLVIQDSIQKSAILSEVKTRLLIFGNEARKPANRAVLKAHCPSFVETRWYVLYDLLSFALDHHQQCCTLGLLDDDDVSRFYAFKILLYPLIQLHLIFENDYCRLRHVFPAVIYAINLYFSIVVKGIFGGPWLTATKVIIQFLFQRFLHASTGDVNAAAYSLTPEGTIARYKGEFTRPRAFPNLTSHPKPLTAISATDKQFDSSETTTAPPLSTHYVDYAIHHIFSIHFPPQTGGTRSGMEKNIRTDEYLQNLLGQNKQLDQLITSFHEFNSQRVQSSRTNTDPSTERVDDDESDDLNLLELISEQLIDDEDSDSDMDYIEHSTNTSFSSSSSSSSSQQAITSTEAAASSRESQIAKSLSRNELIYDDLSQSLVSLRTLLRRRQNQPPSTTSASSSFKYTESATALVTWDASGTPEVLELDPQPAVPHIDSESISSESEDMKELSLLYSTVHGIWYDRIIKGFQYYTKQVLREASSSFLSSLSEYFSAYLESYSDVSTQDLDALFYSRSADTPYTAIYSYLAHGLVSASCSEASCERCFSILRWIVGTRRYSLSLDSMACLLGLCTSHQ